MISPALNVSSIRGISLFKSFVSLKMLRQAILTSRSGLLGRFAAILNALRRIPSVSVCVH